MRRSAEFQRKWRCWNAERYRDGGPPVFVITLHACALVENKKTGRIDLCKLEVAGPAPIQLNADRDTWHGQIRNISPLGSVLVEIPLTLERKPPWNSVWSRMNAASANLTHGGESGWKNCVGEVRQAIAAWRQIDEFQAGKNDPKKDQRQRLHDIANAVHHYCSLSAHDDEHEINWSRSDAVLALSSLCALLSARDP
jgi:hypothetical protein